MGIGPYNGWTGAQRLATIPVQHAALESGCMRQPRRCSICRIERNDPSGPRIALHDEDYAHPLRAYPICLRCHNLLHRRFSQPEPWLRLLRQHARDNCWFAMLSLDRQSLQRPFNETYPDGLPLPDPADFD